MVKVVFVRSNSLATSPRIYKESRSIANAHYEVTILGWLRESSSLPAEIWNSSILVKRFKLRAPSGKKSISLFLAVFWLWVICKLLVLKPEVVHSCDLDAAIPAYIYKRLKPKTRFIFDVFDRYAMANIPRKHRVLYSAVNLVEALLASKADLFITVSESLLGTFSKFRIKKSIVIRNTPRREDIERIKSKAQRKDHKTLRVYMSHLERETILAFRAIRRLPNVKLVLTGRIKLSPQVVHMLLQSSQVEFHGIVSYEKALSVEYSTDAFLLLYDPSIEISRYRLSGNRVFEALMMDKVVLTNVWDNYVYGKISPYIKVDYNERSIREAVQSLAANKDSSNSFLKHSKDILAVKDIYCWEAVEEKLLIAYRELVVKKSD